MNVTTDPRIMRQLLLSQWISGGNPLAPSLSAGIGEGDGGDLFELLLSQYMEDSSSDTMLPLAPASVQVMPAAPGPMPVLPVSIAEPSRVGSAGPLTQAAEDSGHGSDYDGLISAAAAKYGIPAALIKGVIQTESGFYAEAVSHAGAKGLMQLMDDTARGLGVADSFDPEQNIDGGARFLSYLLRKYDGNVMSALAAYNAGPGRVDRLGLITDERVQAGLEELPEETRRYVGKVLEAARGWGLQG